MSNTNEAQAVLDQPTKDTAIASRAERVTLFEDRAEVTRRATFTAKKGARWEAFAGVSLLVDDGSVQAKVVSGKARVLAVRVLRRAHLAHVLGREEIEALEKASKDAETRVKQAGQTIERAQRVLQQHFQLADQWVKAVALGPKKASEPAVLATYRDAWRSIDEAARGAVTEVADARAESLVAEDERKQAEMRLAQGRVERPRYDAVIEVELDTKEDCDVDLELSYRVPCALWRPEHLARLSTETQEAPSGSVEIVTYATAWQITGEVWSNVELRFSTARPARAASAPVLSDDVLSTRRKSDEERRQVVVAVREQSIQLAGLDRGERAVEEMPGVDDGGEPQLFVGKERIDLPSTGRPFRVEIGRVKVKADLGRVVLAARSSAAHLRATATLEGAGPLLAGPVRLARGSSMVGHARLDFVGKGEPFELGFGPDGAIRVRRADDEERETQAITGTQKIKRKVKIFLSNLSNEPKKMLVTERIPVSEIDDVQIELLDAGGFTLDAKDGFLKANVEIGPNATKTMAYVFEVKAASRVVLPEL